MFFLASISILSVRLADVEGSLRFFRESLHLNNGSNQADFNLASGWIARVQKETAELSKSTEEVQSRAGRVSHELAGVQSPSGTTTAENEIWT